MPQPISRRHLMGMGMGGALATALSPIAMRQAQAGPEAGWIPLFNGKDLSGWTFFQDGVGDTDTGGVLDIQDGTLHVLGPTFQGDGKVGFGHLATAQEYGNYHLRLEFKWGGRRFAPRRLAKRNSGILYHMKATRGVLYPDSVEFQVEETDVGDAIMINTQALEGPNLGGTALWPSYPPSFPREYVPPIKAGPIERQWFRKTGDFERLDSWNQLDLIAFGDQAAHLVNGRIVTTLFAMRTRREDNPAVWRPLTGGRIALEIEAAEISFRNIILRPLSDNDIKAVRDGSY